MSLDQVRTETQEALGDHGGNLAYLTDELLSEYESSAEEADEEDVARTERLGNRIAYKGGRIYWTSGTPGTDNYQCGSGRRWSISAATHVAEYVDNCWNNNLTYFLIRRR